MFDVWMVNNISMQHNKIFHLVNVRAFALQKCCTSTLSLILYGHVSFGLEQKKRWESSQHPHAGLALGKDFFHAVFLVG